MSFVPRFAVGSIQSQANLQPILWALLDALDREGIRIQCYQSRSCFSPVDGVTSITGLSPRHLDSWLMSPEQCRALFLRTAGQSDLAILEGRFDDDGAADGGTLEPLCQWLGAPRLAAVDVSQLGDCKLPPRPLHAAAILLDGVVDERDFVRWQTVLEPLWGVPVVGGLGALPSIRDELRRLEPGQTVARDLCRALGNHLLRFTRADRLMQLAARADSAALHFADAAGGVDYCDDRALDGIRIAVAYDDVFHCYFPDALDALEACGAELCDFSPLRDEGLPADADIVVVGCGHPERFSRQLAQNECMISALRSHVCAGKRIYAEGGGAAYLSQSLVLPSGESVPMAGVFPAVARFQAARLEPRPVAAPLACDSWIGAAGTIVRGYLNDAWSFEPVARLRPLAHIPNASYPLVLRHQAVGSRIHLNVAAQPRFLGRFLRPCPAALAWAVVR
jgi:cobyrinic acid a,c-diamide synthase